MQKNIESYLCAERLLTIPTTGGLTLTADKTLEQSGVGDVILIPALWRNPIPVVRKHPKIVQWLKDQYDLGHHLLERETGVAFIAATGLLDKLPATTHWSYMEKLQYFYPEVDFKPNHLITRAGRIYCAGSVNSVADLMVHLIGKAFGESIAQTVEQQFSHEIRKPFKDTHFAQDHATAHQDEAIIALQGFIHHQFTDEITLDLLVGISGLNKRTLNRRFLQATGCSPMAYIRNIRLDHAKDLLKNTNLSITEVAIQIGYRDADYFSRQFKLHHQLTPSGFRKSVRAKLFYICDK